MGSDGAVVVGVLLSGGMDSIAVTWWLRPDVAFTVGYGQASGKGELRAAQAVCNELSIPHEEVYAELSRLGSGDLFGNPPLPMAPVPEWWPYRNQLLVTVAAIRGLSLGVDRLVVGSVRTDAEHADGTAPFYERLDRVMSMQEGGVRVEAPAISLTTAELVRLAQVPRSVLAWAHSCHTSEYACGQCRGCQKHLSVTQELWGEPY